MQSAGANSQKSTRVVGRLGLGSWVCVLVSWLSELKIRGIWLLKIEQRESLGEWANTRILVLEMDERE